jgi:predicted nuclease with RNAse H fold
MGIKFFPITLGPMRMLTARGMRLRRRLERCGLKVIETYPGAAQDLLGMKRKQYGLDALQRSLAKVGCTGDIMTRRLSGDELDAISCALVAKDYSRGRYLSIGDPLEIMMILPKNGAP